MATERKKQYMKQYNMLPYVKEKKAKYMRRIRSESDKKASQNLVNMLLGYGYEDLAFEYAKERAPEMLAVVRTNTDRRLKYNLKMRR